MIRTLMMLAAALLCVGCGPNPTAPDASWPDWYTPGHGPVAPPPGWPGVSVDHPEQPVIDHGAIGTPVD